MGFLTVSVRLSLKSVCVQRRPHKYYVRVTLGGLMFREGGGGLGGGGVLWGGGGGGVWPCQSGSLAHRVKLRSH